MIGTNPLLCALSRTQSNTPEETTEKQGTSAKKETSDKLKNVLEWCCHRDESFQTSSQNGMESQCACVHECKGRLCLCECVCVYSEFLSEAYGV